MIQKIVRDVFFLGQKSVPAQPRDIQVGQDLTVSFDIDAREYQGRWFNSIRAWRVTPAVQAAPGVMPAAAYGAEVPPVAPVASAPAAPAAAPLASDESSDLPF